MPAQGNFTNPNDPWGFSNPMAQLFGSGGYGNQNMAQFMSGGAQMMPALGEDRTKRKQARELMGGFGGGMLALGGPSGIRTTPPFIGEMGMYDPTKFVPQGRPPATPGANAAVAEQSQVIHTPEGIAEKYEQKQAALEEQLKASSDIMQTLQSPAGAKGDLTQAILDNLGGRQTLGTGPGSTNQRGVSSVVNPNGGGYFAVPKDFQAANPGNYGTSSPLDADGTLADTSWILNGATRYPKLNQTYAQSLTAQVGEAMKAGQPITGILPENLSARPDIAAALADYQSAYDARAALPSFGTGTGNRFTPPQLIQQAQSGLQDSYNTYVQDYYGNQAAQGQAYLDMMGGGAFGGVLPSATNPQWYDTTPTMMEPGQLGEDRARQQAMNSPWGQAGAPWSSQAWAGGNFNPMTGPQFSQNGQIQPNPPPWFGSNGMFNPNQFNPQMVTNAPWGTPTKPTGDAQGSMTFGQSPWGSFW
jgi:hypothetical protein